MCGICGIMDAREPVAERAARVAEMNARMQHRGPDDGGQVDLPSMSLAMRRLAILDLSPAGHQPMWDPSGRVVVAFNGEIYNFREERARLEAAGVRFRSHSDTEVILQLYLERGARFVERLRGMFAVAIWDTRSDELLLARDRLGIKPLYYRDEGDRLAFASEIRALLPAMDQAPRLSMQGLDHYLVFGWPPSPQTLLEDVLLLPPGHILRVRGREREVTRYWTLPAEGAIRLADAEVLPAIRRTLERSIELHQVSDVPVGAFLSGGIDSTAIVGLMSRVVAEPVRTFAVGFEHSRGELDYARLAADSIGTRHTEVIVGGRDAARDLRDIVAYIDQPSIDGVNTWFVSKAARKSGLVVALSGLGGDEVFGGYRTFRDVPRWARLARAWGRLPRGARVAAIAAARAIVGPARRRKLAWLDDVRGPLDLYLAARRLHSDGERARLAPDVPRADHRAQLRCEVDAAETHWQMVAKLESRHYMGDRLLRDTDVMSMAHSLEVRVPFVDHEVVELGLGLSPKWHARGAQAKPLLVKALADVIPRDIVTRRKVGFEMPLSHWMRHELREVVEDCLAPATLRARGLLAPDEVGRLRAEHERGGDHLPVWQLVVLELWMRHLLPEAAA